MINPLKEQIEKFLRRCLFGLFKPYDTCVNISSVFSCRLLAITFVTMPIFLSSGISFGKEIINTTHTDTTDTITSSTSYHKFIVPTALISYGALTRLYEPLKTLDVSIHNEVSKHVNRKIKVDDYLQYIPMAALYSLDFAGIKAKHNGKERMITGVSSFLIMTAVVHTIKRTTQVSRPDYGAKTSFPSGHTATAFTGAHLLFREYQDVSPLIGLSAYTVATATGVFRVLNKRHWLSDVITGAGVGVLSAEISYLLLPVFCKTKNQNSNLTIVPAVDKQGFGVVITYDF